MNLFSFRCGGICLLIFFSASSIFAQIDTVKLPPVVVTSFKDETLKQTSIQIQPITIQQIQQSGAFNVSDALAKIPGISQLTTGVAISKPVIRGLYGNRVLVLFSGLRFDNQQWQDEHGLGLSDLGISRIELIKGPYSLLHGTEAVAGVINIIEENAPDVNTQQQDFGIRFNSNTLGGMMQYGYKANYGNSWMRIRAGAESNADYSDGNNTRVLNSRFDGYYLAATYGFKKHAWTSVNNYNSSFNRYGFIFSDITDFFEQPDARWSRDFPGPHHVVALNIASSQNTFYLQHSGIKLNVGAQSNLRMEDEGGGAISLNMHLVTGEYTFRWLKTISDKLDFVAANISSVENNTNYGKRRIIPDAWMAESSGSGYMKYTMKKSILEFGAGVGTRYIKTLLTEGVNSPDKDIPPFEIYRPFINGMAGISYNPNSILNIKVNFASGVRSPNLAELASNGLHEGSYQYEIGDPDLKNEKNINSDFSVTLTGRHFNFYINGFYNHFIDYIYLDPTSEEWFGFQIFRYRQQTADLYGTETGIGFTPAFLKHTEMKVDYSGMTGITNKGDYLPFIPAQKITPEIRIEEVAYKSIDDIYVFVNTDFVMEQNNTAPDESASGSYELLNAGAGCTVHTKSFPLELSVTGNNLLNEAYVDHLSRFRDLGYLNIGMNIVFNCKIIFSKNLKQSEIK